MNTKLLSLFSIVLVALSACGGNAATAVSGKSTAGAATDKHTTEYITQRLETAFNNYYKDTGPTILTQDSLYMSAAYCDLQNKALAIADRREDCILDADHWVQGQDTDHPSMRIDSIVDITPTTALAHITVTNFGEATHLRLPLVFERDDWYIDDMVQDFEGETLSEKSWYIRYVDSDGKILD